MSKRKVKGVDLNTGMMLAGAISRETTPLPEKPNARCNRCGNPLLATPALLGPVKMGIVDHAGCGGQFVALPAVSGEPSE